MSAAPRTLTATRLRELLHYDPQTGVFTWIVDRHPIAKGDIAGTIGVRGYVRIKLFGVKHYAHRLAFLYVNSVWPNEELDHRNRIRSDNHWLNLRPATSAENKQNTGILPSNTSGFKGVSFDKRTKKWRAQISVKNQGNRTLGYFSTTCEAAAAYAIAAGELHNFNPAAILTPELTVR